MENLRVPVAPVHHQPGGEKEEGKGEAIGPIGPIGPTIALLQDEIIRMQGVILYYEHRILQKKIAMEELLAQLVAPPLGNAAAWPPRAPERAIADRRSAARRATGDGSPSVTQMANAVLLQMTEPVFTQVALREAMVKQYPQHRGKIMRGYYSAIAQLCAAEETVIRNPDGTLSKK